MTNWTFETHRYAPELNKAYYKGVEVELTVKRELTNNHDYNVKLLRSKLNHEFKKVAIVCFSYDDIVNNRYYRGTFKNYKSLLKTIKKMKEKHDLGKFSIEFKYKN